MDLEKMASNKVEVSTDAELAGRVVTNNVSVAVAEQEELRKSFSVWSLGSLCLCLMASWEAISSVVAQALVSGGAPCLFYNYVISFLGSVAIVVSLAEIASICPTAGGQYHWVALLAPPKHRVTASWVTGWITIGGQIVFTASAAFAGGLQLQALITVNNPDSYIPQRYQGMLFYWLVLLYSLVVNIWGSKVLPHMNLASGVLHVVGFVAITIVLLAMAPKHSAYYVFVETQNETGWSSDGIAWLVGLLSSIYPLLGYDCAVHLAEEMPNPKRDVPLAMVGSVLINGVIALIYTIVLLFCLGHLNSLLTSPTGFPFMQLFLNTTRSEAGATVMTLIISLIAVAANAAALTSTSRTVWAFARDNAMPGARYFAHVDTRFHVPVRMIVFVSVLEMLLGLIYLGNSTAFNAVLSMAILGLYLSYVLPIIYMLLFGRKGNLKATSFNLGRIGGPVTNILAIAWLIFAMIFSTFPNYEPVTAVNMNYSTVVLGGWMFFGSVYYIGFGRKKYQGPIFNVDQSVLATVLEKEHP